MEALNFNVVGYGCTTCIGNSGPLIDELAEAIEKNNLVVAGVLSGNRNFEGRIHPHVKANYLASPPLVVAYALAGRIDINWETDPIGTNPHNNNSPVFLRDIWPSDLEVEQFVKENVLGSMFREVYSKVTEGTESWNQLTVSSSLDLYNWNEESTYIHSPPYFTTMERNVSSSISFSSLRCLLRLGDSITTDHISPASNISINSPAARYLLSRNVPRSEFNSYGARRGNDQVMCRGTFANIRLANELISPKIGPQTIFYPTETVLDVWDAAEKYLAAGTGLIILAGEQYGSGSSRDWAAKGVWMMGVKVVIAKSFERIHRSNLVQFGVVPLEFKKGEGAKELGLEGDEEYRVNLEGVGPRGVVKVGVSGGKKGEEREIECVLRFDTETEWNYYKNGGVLNKMIRQSL
eukprot:TRINITY_DN924_c0_g1_i3.p1 TRINITY_DN924_c0_g1~~TRINITY_DN924_c0_g1_i3.p1  ORF type:complete len:407 (-),score=107.25 TRINITY_DN924_c0_g1_i3:33-1253(-)